MVEFVDGSVVAQMSPPDMKLPIQFALHWPQRRPGIGEQLDFSDRIEIHFEPADRKRFAALELGMEAAAAGGTSGAVLNAANEAAVAGFLQGELPFIDIVPACRTVFDQHPFESTPSLERLLELDHWAREEVYRWVCM